MHLVGFEPTISASERLQTYALDRVATGTDSIKKWYAKFRDEGRLCTAPQQGRLGPSKETVNWIREAYLRSPCKSITCASLQLGVARSTP